MYYVSTRGQAPRLDFADTLLTGLAGDGGLYVPEAWPSFSPTELERLAGLDYCELARSVLTPFVGTALPASGLEAAIERAYRHFGHAAVTPLVQIGTNAWLLELFHGPTLAFKDIAMQLLAPLMEQVLATRHRRATIIGATSGDTGGAAIEAFRGIEAVDVFILFPDRRVSDVQRRQMTTVADDNVHAIAIDGTFDDCQALVKAMFADTGFRNRMGLSGVNSINWARIMAQTVYYFAAALALGAPARTLRFSVPTGNFGDVLAGYVAFRMGLPVERLLVATNVNDILDRALRTGRYEIDTVIETTSPSMDIQVSSNFERLLFEAYGRDAAAVKDLMSGLSQSGAFTIGSGALSFISTLFTSGRVDEAETMRTIRATIERTGELIDPHTAVGLAVAEREADGDSPMVTLATAHPAKFPDAIEAATGIRPALPARLADLHERAERFDTLPNDVRAVEAHIMDRSSFAGARA